MERPHACQERYTSLVFRKNTIDVYLNINKPLDTFIEIESIKKDFEPVFNKTMPKSCKTDVIPKTNINLETTNYTLRLDDKLTEEKQKPNNNSIMNIIMVIIVIIFLICIFVFSYIFFLVLIFIILVVFALQSIANMM